jgi:hypothetical protein
LPETPEERMKPLEDWAKKTAQEIALDTYIEFYSASAHKDMVRKFTKALIEAWERGAKESPENKEKQKRSYEAGLAAAQGELLIKSGLLAEQDIALTAAQKEIERLKEEVVNLQKAINFDEDFDWHICKHNPLNRTPVVHCVYCCKEGVFHPAEREKGE